MDVATGMKTVRWMGARKAGLMLVGTLVIGAGLLASGGCANQKDEQIAQLNSEIAALKEEKAQIEQARIAAEAKAAEAATRPQATDRGNNMMAYDPPAERAPARDVVITVAGDVLFASGQTTLKPEAKKELDDIARRLNTQYAGHRIRIEGYTDSDPIRKSKFPSNEALSEARAQAVESYLISKGVPSNRISSVGMGSAKPKATKAASRRVEIVVMDQ